MTTEHTLYPQHIMDGLLDELNLLRTTIAGLNDFIEHQQDIIHGLEARVIPASYTTISEGLKLPAETDTTS